MSRTYVISPSDMLALGTRATISDFQSKGEPARLSMRELLLVHALRNIVSGETKTRAVKKAATRAIERWASEAQRV